MCEEDSSCVSEYRKHCNEAICGTIYRVGSAEVFGLGTEVRPSSIAGCGLFSVEGGVREGGIVIGRFGGRKICGLCADIYKNQYSSKGSYDVIALDLEYRAQKDDIFWHFLRTHDSSIDGKMWFINASLSTNSSKEYQAPNIFFEFAGFDSNNDPLLEVKTLPGFSAPELVAQYFNDE